MSACTVIVTQRVRAGQTDGFLRAQEGISGAMRQFPGFLGKELIRPAPGLQDDWVAVFRFASTESLERWMGSEERRAMRTQLALWTEGEEHLQVVAGEDAETPPVTMIITHRVKRGCEALFGSWRERMLEAMSAHRGFLGVDCFEPQPGVQEEWVHIVRFDSAASLEDWMGSGVRVRLLRDLGPLVESYTVRPLASGLGGWFAFDDGPAARSAEPPRWKQILMVTLGLYPTVMLLALLVDPWLKWLPFPVHMVLANLLCVSLLSWPVMPWLNRRFARWLSPTRLSPRRDLAGALMVVAILCAWVALFLVIWRAGFLV